MVLGEGVVPLCRERGGPSRILRILRIGGQEAKKEGGWDG